MNPRQKLIASLGLERPPPLLDEALTHRSYANERRGRGPRGQGPRPRDNQRLEFLGDAVLCLCVSELLMASFPDADEGQLSRMRSNLVNAEPLADYGKSINLGAALRLGRGALASGDHQQINVLADAVEALVGAVYLDGGLPAARALVGQIVQGGLADAGALLGLDPKSALQERVQAEGMPAPVYRLESPDAPESERWFFAEVTAGEQSLGKGRGRSKKSAEQAAARDALRNLSARPTSEQNA